MQPLYGLYHHPHAFFQLYTVFSTSALLYQATSLELITIIPDWLPNCSRVGANENDNKNTWGNKYLVFSEATSIIVSGTHFILISDWLPKINERRKQVKRVNIPRTYG